MAHIDNLVASIADPTLREALREEIRKIAGSRTFGLVFNEHKPESVLLPKQDRVRRGDKVRLMIEGTRDRTEVDNTGVWVVAKIDGATAHLTHRSDESIVCTAPRNRCVIVRELSDHIYPGLRSTGRLNHGGDKPHHVVINGENFHALKALRYPYAGKVDAIYIDPPYNSGAKVWKYNNDFVDKDDGYRHSKWLAMMDKRLQVAKELLNPANSVLIVAIDENEVHRLALLLEQTFKTSKMQMVTVLINPAGASIADQFSRVDEHLLFVHIGDARPARTAVETTPGSLKYTSEEAPPPPFKWEPFQRSGGNSRRQDTKAKFFPVWVHEQSETIIGCGDHLPETVLREDAPSPPAGCVAQWPIKQNGTEACWQLSAPTFRRYLEEGRIKIGRRRRTTGRWGFSFLTTGHMSAIARGDLVVSGRDPKGSLLVEVATGRRIQQVGKTMWTNGAYSATEHGSTLLGKFLPRRTFPFPKSLYAVEDALRYYLSDKPNATILDFFAGSGTTAHAVMRLNHADGGRRRSIIVTNNEVSDEEALSLRQRGIYPGDDQWEALGIYEHITKPRLSAAVTGLNSDGAPVQGNYRFVDPFPMSEGFEENVEYFDLTYEDPSLVSLGRKFQAIAPLLWFMAGAQGDRIESVPENVGWAVPDHAGYGVLTDPTRWSAFIGAVHARQSSTSPISHAFIVTDSDSEYRQVISKLPAGIATQRLYRDYLRNFEINSDD